MAQQPKNTDAVGVAQLAENIRQTLKRVRPGQQLADHIGVGGFFAVIVGQQTVIHVFFLLFARTEMLFAPLAESGTERLTFDHTHSILRP